MPYHALAALLLLLAPIGRTAAVPADQTEALAAVREILKVLSYERPAAGTFNIGNCDGDPGTWVRAALTSTGVQKTYRFRDGCDVEGTFAASFYDAFPLRLKVRNLRAFTTAALRVKLRIRQEARGISFRFEVPDGALVSPFHTVTFAADYEATVDPHAGVVKAESETGTVRLRAFRGRPAAGTTQLRFK